MIATAAARDVRQKMNKTEARYADALELRRIAGVIREWKFEQVTLKLADDLRYTPDFFVVRADGEVEFHEVKGFWRDDARQKIRMAAAAFPFRFYAFQAAGKDWKAEDFTDSGIVVPTR